jgi:hypothetical protein
MPIKGKVARHTNLAKKTNQRRESRTAVNGTLRILWEDTAGNERISQAQIINISRSGAQLRVAEKIPLRSYVVCNDEKLGIQGRASVRYCDLVEEVPNRPRVHQ